MSNILDWTAAALKKKADHAALTNNLILAKMLDDKSNKGKFAIEIGEKEKEVELQLTNEELRFVNSDIRYLMDPDEKLFIKLYYHDLTIVST